MSRFKSEATRLLEARNQGELRRDMVQVADNVYAAVGYTPANVAMIVGDSGVIIVDTGMDRSAAETILTAFREISSLPIVGIVLTHGHSDHIGGLDLFLEAADAGIEVWARDNFRQEDVAFNASGLRIHMKRGLRQGGFALPRTMRVNNGIAPAVYPNLGRSAGASADANDTKTPFASSGRDSARPTHIISERTRITLAGVELDLVPQTGETYDHLYLFYPDKGILATGDNFYSSWPNLYPIRGTPYRNIAAWIDSLTLMIAEAADAMIPGHTRPVIGKDSVAETLTTYRDAIKFVYDKTIEGMNQGLTPDQLVEYVQLPAKYADIDYLRPYYGHPEWAVRSIFNYYLGWFDGNPTNLFRLRPMDEAQRMIELVGGADVLLSKAQAALAKQDFQWACQLCDYLLAIHPEAKWPARIKADALEALADETLSGIGRNYYNTVAQELRAAANFGDR